MCGRRLLDSQRVGVHPLRVGEKVCDSGGQGGLGWLGMQAAARKAERGGKQVRRPKFVSKECRAGHAGAHQQPSGRRGASHSMHHIQVLSLPCMHGCTSTVRVDTKIDMLQQKFPVLLRVWRCAGWMGN